MTLNHPRPAIPPPDPTAGPVVPATVDADAGDAVAPHPAGGRRWRWLNQSAFALLDQGLFAGSNFALNVLLANWLLPDAYGAFSKAFGIFLLLATVHNGLLVEPMLVFGPKRFGGRLPGYFGGLVLGNWVVSAGVTAVLLAIAVGGWIVGTDGSRELARAAVGFAIVGPLILLLWLMRRACYVDLNPQRAAIAGAAYFTIMTGGVVLARAIGELTIATALAVMALGSLVCSVWLIRREGASLRAAREQEMLGEITSAHWQYGRWAAPSGVVGFFPAWVYLLLLPLEETGTLRALTNFALPFMQAIAALCVLILPRLVRARGTPQFARTLRLALAVLAVGPILVWVALGVFHEPLVRAVYGGRYLESSHLLWWIGLQPALTGVAGVLMASLEARERPDRVFYASAVTAGASVVIGLVVVAQGGLTSAAAIGTVVNMLINAVVLAAFTLDRLDARQRGSSASGGVSPRRGNAVDRHVIKCDRSRAFASRRTLPARAASASMGRMGNRDGKGDGRW